MRTQPISQVDVEQEMMRLVSSLEIKTEQFEKLAVDSAQKEAALKSQWAKTYLTVGGTIRDREAQADNSCEHLFADHKVAEAMVKACRETLLFLRTSIDALRSLNANVRYQTND